METSESSNFFSNTKYSAITVAYFTFPNQNHLLKLQKYQSFKQSKGKGRCYGLCLDVPTKSHMVTARALQRWLYVTSKLTLCDY